MLKIYIKNKSFNENKLIENLDIEINRGLYLLQGENGSGKTTLLNMIFRLDEDYDGEISLDNKSIIDIKLSDYRTRYITYINQSFDLFLNLSPLENLELLVKNCDKDKLDEILEGFDLYEVINSKKKVNNFSGGQKQKMKLLIGLLSNTPILLVDEPDNNLDIKSIEFLASFLQKENKIIIIIAHTFDEFLDNYKINLLELKDKKIINNNTLLNNEETIPSDENKLNISGKILKKFKKDLRIKRLMMYSLFFVLINALFIIISLLVSSFNDLHSYKDPMSDNVLEIFMPSSNVLVENYKDKNALDKTPFYFTNEFYEELKNQDEVSYITPISIYGRSVGRDKYEVKLQIDTSILDYQKYGMEDYNYGNTIFNVEENSCIEPKRVNENGINTCLPSGKLIYGEYPDDNSNQIVIDVYMAMHFAQEKELENLEELIGQEVEIDVNYDGMIDVKGNELSGDKTLTFIVSGISEPLIQDFEYFMLPYEIGSVEDIRNHPWYDISLYPELSSKEDALLDFLAPYRSLGFPEPVVGDLPPLKDNAYPGFYIETKTPEDIPILIEKIKDYDPYITFKSNYTADHSSNFVYMKKYYIKKSIELVVFFSIFLLSIIFMMKYYTNILEENIKKFKRFGFENDEILKYIRLNNKTLLNGIITTLVLVLVIFGILSWLNISLIIVAVLFAIMCYILIRILIKNKGEIK